MENQYVIFLPETAVGDEDN